MFVSSLVIAIVSLVFSLISVLLNRKQTSAAERQAAGSSASAMVDARNVCLEYFDYEFVEPASSASKNIKDFRLKYMSAFQGSVADFDAERRERFENEAKQRRSPINNALWQMSVQLNRLGVACMISAEVLKFTLALQAKPIAQDWTMLSHFIDSTGERSPEPAIEDRRGAFWLMFVAASYLRFEHPGVYGKLPQEFQEYVQDEETKKIYRRIEKSERSLIDSEVIRMVAQWPAT